jgi:hypothetical protein
VRGEVHTGFWWGRLKEGGHLEDLGVDGSMVKVKGRVHPITCLEGTEEGVEV